jgi:hypothetical protein
MERLAALILCGWPVNLIGIESLQLHPGLCKCNMFHGDDFCKRRLLVGLRSVLAD